jgi:hypothetical protein
MKFFILNALLGICGMTPTLGQISKAEICEFSNMLYQRKLANYGYGNPRFPGTIQMMIGNYRCIGVDAMSNYFMQQAFAEANPILTRQHFMRLCEKPEDFYKFTYQILIETEGNKRYFIYLINVFCGSEKFGNEFYEYLVRKNAGRIAKDIQRLKAGDGTKEKKEDPKPTDSIRSYLDKMGGVYLLVDKTDTSKLAIHFTDARNFDFSLKGINESCSFTLAGKCTLEDDLAVYSKDKRIIKFLFFSNRIEVNDNGAPTGADEICTAEGNYIRASPIE